MNYDFLDYHLPDERIAQRPVADERSNSKLLHACCYTLQSITSYSSELMIEDEHYFDLPNILCPGDLLILNNTKVQPCRFFVRLENSENEIEILLVRKTESEKDFEIWEALARPMKRLKIGKSFALTNNLDAIPLGRSDDDSRIILKIFLSEKINEEARPVIEDVIRHDAVMPIPPYIRKGHADEKDRLTYQNVYAEKYGSIAAPTAGFHFSENLLGALEEKGVQHKFVTLHVGTASFTPIRECDVPNHKMASEFYEISDEVRQAILVAKHSNRRVIVVGTTCLRALESAVLNEGLEGKWQLSGATNLFITPGFKFNIADCLITNFHQPKSTHLLLVASFIGAENTEKIYQHALNENNYRFLSYGDGMLLEK